MQACDAIRRADVAHFKPLVIDDERLEKLKSLFDLEEAERIAATEREGYSWEEVKEHLRLLEKQG